MSVLSAVLIAVHRWFFGEMRNDARVHRGDSQRRRRRSTVQGAHRCAAGLQSLVGSAGSIGDPPVHRHGLRLQRVLAAVVQGAGYYRVDCVSGRYGPVRAHGGHHLRLEDQPIAVDVHAVLRVAGLLGSDLGRLAGTCRPAQGRCGLGAVLVRRPGDLRGRYPLPSDLDAVAGLGCDWRYRPGVGLHLAGVDLDQMVPGPSRYGDGHGDHGFRRRRDNRQPAGRCADASFRHPHLGGRDGNLRGDGGAVLRLHDGRCVRLPRAAERLDPGRLDPGRLDPGRLDRTGGKQQCHDHRQPRARKKGLGHSAVLVAMGRAVPERFGRYRSDRHVLAHVAGSVRRPPDRRGRGLR